MNENDEKWFSEIAARLRAGNEEALSAVLERLGPRIVATLKSKFFGQLTEEDCEDILSETLSKLWAKRGTIDVEKGNLFAWVHLVARNGAIDRLRRAKKQPQSTVSFGEVEELLKNMVAVAEHAEDQPDNLLQLRRHLEEIFCSLSAREKRLLECEFMYRSGEKSRELAEEFGISINALRQLRFRVKEKLRHKLARKGIVTGV